MQIIMKYLAVILLGIFVEITASPWDSGTRCPPVLFPNGKVRSRGRGKIIRFSCFEGFTLVGNKYSTCVRGSWDTPTPVCVNSQCSIPLAPVHALVATKYNGAILMYFCEPGYVLVGSTEIYCNGKQWNGTAPYCRDTTISAPLKCDFEKRDLCWWEQDPLHDFDWRRHNFETPSSHIGTGPTHDHTLGPGNDGYYLYIEASGRLVNDTARIISPLYNSSLTNFGCFSFWYHMYGATIGALRVYVREEYNTSMKLMFEKQSNQGNQWHHGLFRLPKLNNNFQIIIEGVRGKSYVSDLAIDDVAILQGDECAQKINTVVTTPGSVTNENDQIEIINAMQSCRGRCGDSHSTNIWTTILPPTAPDACFCTINCAENSTCCPDFAEFCVLAVSDTSNPLSTTRKMTTPMMMMSTTQESMLSTISPQQKSHISIEPKDDIDPYATNPTLKSSTTTTTLINNKLTTLIKIPVLISSTTVNIETPFATKNNYNYIKTTTINNDIKKTSESQILIEHFTDVKSISTFGLSEIISIIVVLITVGIIITVVTLFLLRRRKTYKRGSSNGNASILSEDSDVRFLTSDEVLDFNLARPTDFDEL